MYELIRTAVRLLFYQTYMMMMICYRQYMNGGVCQSRERIDGKVVIVTGANTGIGKETAMDLVQRGLRQLFSVVANTV